MPRPRKAGVIPKTRSRTGCWPCKGRKVKCGEEKPRCLNCERQGETCDYSIRLNWGGRTKRDSSKQGADSGSSAANSPYQSTLSFEATTPPLHAPHSPETSQSRTHIAHHGRSQSATSAATSEPEIDPELMRTQHSQSQPTLPANAFHDRSSPPQEPAPQRTAAPFGVFEYSGSFDYPSPVATSFDVTNFSNAGYPAFTTAPSMPPPTYTTSNSRQFTEPMESVLTHHQSHPADSPAPSDAYSPPAGPSQTYSSFGTMPLTPNSSVGVDEPVRSTSRQETSAYQPVDPHRLSVQSLLSGPPGDSTQGRRYPIGDDEYTVYGYDVGLPDLDIHQNDDSNAIAVFSPPSGTMDIDGDDHMEDAEPRGKDMAFEKDGYYAKPVPIKISKSLEPLPPLLLENPMNLLYFHHFLNHTAHVLVPHDCEKNPFRLILPEMAVKDENIMALLLAYSASHRARMLDHDEPATRIAMWVRDVFPKLRASLANPSTITNETLAPAIMMASLEIISPNTFEVPISWQDHLAMARRMIIARGGLKSMDKEDPGAYFLNRWFAYLDVLGSLSGNMNEQPLGSWYAPSSPSSPADTQIDCLTGFTPECTSLLAVIASLAHATSPHRIRPNQTINPTYRPPKQILEKAEQVRKALWNGITSPAPYTGCPLSASAPATAEITAANAMFHYAALIHLYRRVYNHPTSHPAVQSCVSSILSLLDKVRRGSAAEANLLFPMFAAGCEAVDAGQRESVRERLRGVEGWGMGQVGRARGVLERCWREGRGWEEGVVGAGEFFG